MLAARAEVSLIKPGRGRSQAMHVNASDLYLFVALACLATFLRGPL